MFCGKRVEFQNTKPRCIHETTMHKIVNTSNILDEHDVENRQL